MRDAILNFPEQLKYVYKIENSDKLKQFSKFVVVGMGGSALSADLIKAIFPEQEIKVHRNYGLPAGDLSGTLIIMYSYSGNTEEVIDAFNEAKKINLDIAAISIGGKLLELAKSEGVPYVQLPDTGIQPRMSTGYGVSVLAGIMGLKMPDSQSLNPASFEQQGKDLAHLIRGKIPNIYGSAENKALPYVWKINFNENAKIPAFSNVFPELNHNEINGFDKKLHSEQLIKDFVFIFLKDSKDHPRVQKRMAVTAELYRNKGLTVLELDLEGSSRLLKIYYCVILANWTSYYLAALNDVDPVGVPLIEEFKKMIQ